MRQKIKLSNMFHRTDTYVYATNGTISKRQAQRVKKRLCPSPPGECICSGPLGIRGSCLEDQGLTYQVLSDGTVHFYSEEK